MSDYFKIVKRNLTSCFRLQNDTVSVPETNAENPLPVLPEELIDEILLRLPVRPLLQFKCVCKSWKTLISDHQFAKSHLRISNADPQLVTSVIGIGNCKIVSYPVKPLLANPSTPVEPVIISTTRNGYNVIGSCNGLLCLYDVLQYNFTLWNPSINFKSKTSPTIASSSFTHIKLYGFGYDRINDKYKVIVDVRNMAVMENVTRIYTFGENSWRTVPTLPGKSRSGVWVGKFVSGTLNWIVHNSNKWVILSFDLEKEISREVLLPQHDGYWNHKLHVCSNYLCVCVDHSNENHCGVWMMKQYGVAESWTKVIIIPRNNFYYPFDNPLIISENAVLMTITCSQLVCYNNLNNGGIDCPRILGGIDYPRILGELRPENEMHIYHESLVSLHW